MQDSEGKEMFPLEKQSIADAEERHEKNLHGKNPSTTQRYVQAGHDESQTLGHMLKSDVFHKLRQDCFSLFYNFIESSC